MDTLTPAQRSRQMARIHSKDTGPELLVRKALWKLGLRYRLYPKYTPGTPDLWFSKQQTAVFIHGCFWHGHEQCPLYRPPKTDPARWLQKVERNRTRDGRDLLRLLAAGASVVTVWECALRADAMAAVDIIAQYLRAEKPPGTTLEIRAVGKTVQSVIQLGRWD